MSKLTNVLQEAGFERKQTEQEDWFFHHSDRTWLECLIYAKSVQIKVEHYGKRRSTVLYSKTVRSHDANKVLEALRGAYANVQRCNCGGSVKSAICAGKKIRANRGRPYSVCMKCGTFRWDDNAPSRHFTTPKRREQTRQQPPQPVEQPSPEPADSVIPQLDDSAVCVVEYMYERSANRKTRPPRVDPWDEMLSQQARENPRFQDRWTASNGDSK